MSDSQRASFDAAELSVVLSHYDLGVIESVTEFLRGSRRSPKVGVVSERGKFLLKRRAAKRSDLDRVKLSHRVQLHLAAAAFPLAKLILTRQGQQSFVQIRDRIYELFEFVPGHPYERSVEEVRDVGRVLAQFHQSVCTLTMFESQLVPRGDYHDAPGVRTGLCNMQPRLSLHDSFTGDMVELEELSKTLLGSFDRAADTVNRLGFGGWPEQVVHADWHPGNILFRRRRVVAVIDYDSIRFARRVTDIANGALQFSIIAAGDPASWPAELDRDRFSAFLEAYESACPLSEKEAKSLPHLMMEALIAECVPPIFESGSVGRWEGYRVLQMVRRKVAWLEEHGEALIKPGGEPAGERTA